MATVTPDIELIDINKQFPGQRGETATMAVENVNMKIEDGEFFSMLGPSGCGKTTTLRMIAGFEEPTSGKIIIEGRDMVGIPPFHRPVNTVFQDYALFPHMTVAQNIAFGLEMEHKPRKFINERIQTMLDLVQLPRTMSNRYPKQLSGGQQQRVALARALVKEPRVLLLDEPLGALDLKLRKQLQLELKHMQRRLGITFIYVTHDQEEALTMSDRIAVMDHGHVLQIGKPMDIYDRPATRFVADFIGETNFVPACVSEVLGEEANVVVCNQLPLRVSTHGADVKPNDNITIAIRPEKIDLYPTSENPPNSLHGKLIERIFIGTDTRYVVSLDDSTHLIIREQNDLHGDQEHFEVGEEVRAQCSPQYALILTS